MKILDRHLQAARRYAQADRSDPFAYSRAVSHLKSGVASMRSSNPIQEAIWDATRASDGGFTDMKRP